MWKTSRAAAKLVQFNSFADQLAAAFWPGPLSMVLPTHATANLSDLVSAGLATIAVRVPEHPLAQHLLAAFGGPVAAPSANPSGKLSPTTAQHVLQGLDGKIEAVIDGGACGVGLESTVVMPTSEGVLLLREGGIPKEAIEQCIGGAVSTKEMEDQPVSPGQLLTHYAPNTAVRLNVTSPRSDELLLGFGPDAADAALNLSPSADTREAAKNLFAFLRELDALADLEGKTIAVSPVPMVGLGAAINDRLTRAAAA